MTQEEIERLKALAEAATPGPWVDSGAAVQSAYEEPHFDEQLTIADCDMDVRIDHDTRATANAAFIAAARDALPRLIAELEAARAEIALVRLTNDRLRGNKLAIGAAETDLDAFRREAAALREQLEKAAGLLRHISGPLEAYPYAAADTLFYVRAADLRAARAFLQGETPND